MVNALRVVVTGAAGQIGYSILQPIACGQAFGPDQPVHLVLLDLQRCEDVMKGIQVELEDLASPVLAGTTITSSPEVAFQDADAVICLAGLMMIGEGMTRANLLKTNKPIYESHGALLDKHAKKTVKVLVVANPCNTLCLVMSNNAPSIPRKNFCSMSRLDHNRALSMLSFKLGVSTTAVSRVAVFGNHSSTMVPDPSHAVVKLPCGETKKVVDQIKDNEFWSQFSPSVQERAYLVIKYRKNTSALSSAIAAVNHMRSWFCGTPEGDFVSMGVYSDGSYGAPTGVFFSFPCAVKGGEIEVVKDLQLCDAVKEKLKATGEELLKEKQEAGA